MRVILDLPDDVLENLRTWAKNERQSRKGFMEKVLINFRPNAAEPVLSQNKAILDSQAQKQEYGRKKEQPSNLPPMAQSNVKIGEGLTKEQILERIKQLEVEKKEEQAKKCPGYMNPRAFTLAKETKIDEITDEINALRSIQTT